MQRTHAENKIPHATATETRKGLGTIPSSERFHIGDSRIPFVNLHLHFENTGSNKVRVRLSKGLANVTAVYLDSLYCNASTVVFKAGVIFTKANNHFTPSSVHGDSSQPDNAIWIHPKFEKNALGTVTYIIQDEIPRLLRSYRQAEYLSDFEVSLKDKNNNDITWT
jgi:hypothetical protein